VIVRRVRSRASPRLRYRRRDRERLDLQDVAVVREFVETRRSRGPYLSPSDNGWTFTTIAGLDAARTPESVGVQIPLAEIYRASTSTDHYVWGCLRRHSK
jgi:hypothetical protein